MLLFIVCPLWCFFFKRKVIVKAHCTQMKITLCIHALVLLNRLPKRADIPKECLCCVDTFPLACSLYLFTSYVFWNEYNISILEVCTWFEVSLLYYKCVCVIEWEKEENIVCKYSTYLAAWRFKKGITKFLSRDEFAHFKLISTEIQEQGPHSTDQLFRVQFVEA